jgi:Fe-S cluster assembly ATP-binding protein
MVMKLLDVEDLGVRIGDKTILEGLTMGLDEGESYILFGPNGSGKSTLLHAIMGIPPFQMFSGSINFRGKDITGMDVYERTQMGVTVGFQHPPAIDGVRLSELLKICLDKEVDEDFSEEELGLIKRFRLTDFLDRSTNVGFSGGEKKRAEILQMIFLKPRLLLLDEPDSGVDVESLVLIGEEIQRYLEETGSSALIITHKGDILEHVMARYACVLLGGKIHCFAEPKQIYHDIRTRGYEECVNCRIRVEEDWV